MKHYDHSMAAHFGKLLAAREAELKAALDTNYKEELEADQPDDSEVLDFKDLADRESQHDMAALEAVHAMNELSQVLAARHRLLGGSFGQCLECGKPIDLRRLEALPEAALCLACQAAGEKPTRQSSGN
jgi:DnaK suppressor protein